MKNKTYKTYKALLLSVILIMGFSLLAGCGQNESNATDENMSSNEDVEIDFGDSKISEDQGSNETADYSSEIQMVIDYIADYGINNITEESAEKLVIFSHEKGLGTVTDIECSGYESYFDGDTEIFAQKIILYTSDSLGFIAHIGEDGSIFRITYNGDVQYAKEGVRYSLDESTEELSAQAGVDWTALDDIIIDGVDFQYPFTADDLFEYGWECEYEWNEEDLSSMLEPDYPIAITINHPGYSCEGSITIENIGTEPVLAMDLPIRDLELEHFSEEERKTNPLFEFYGLKAGDSTETMESIFGTTDSIYESEQQGYIEYTYWNKMEDGSDIRLTIKVDKDSDEVYGIYIVVLPVN